MAVEIERAGHVAGAKARRGRRWVGVAAATALVLFAAAACGSADEATSGDVAGEAAAVGPPQSGGLLAYGLSADVSSLNPSIGQWNLSSYTVANAVFDPLAAVGEDGTVRPYLAESFSANGDFTSWTIRLREGIVFHDGTRFDAQAVVANLEAAQVSPLIGPALKTMIGVRAVDDLTAEVTFDAPWSTFPSSLTLQAGYMAAPATLAGGAAADPIGTGPFRFESRALGEKIELVANDAYWREGLPYLDAIEFRVIADGTSRGAALAAGDVDVIEIHDPSLLKSSIELADAGDIRLFTNEGQEADESVIALNTSKAPFDDLVARQALAYAIDQEVIAEEAYEGMFPAAWGNFEEGSPFAINREDAGYPEPDPVKARELAEQYERDHGDPLAFTFRIGSDPVLVSIAQYLQQTLREVGIEMTIETGELTANIAAVIGGNYQASSFAMWSTPTLDKGYIFVATEPVIDGFSLNHTRLYDPELAAAMDRARATDDLAEQTEAWREAERRMAANLDRVFLVHNRYAIASVPQVRGFDGATFPDTDGRAFNPTIVNPFPASLWLTAS
jgi:peptide/nickel transport system substrate-binding protein